MRFLRRRKWKLLFGFALFLCLLILNCVLYCNQAFMKKDFVVVIDAGHGGNDPGKIGLDGCKEKDLNLQIAFRLKAKLEARGIRVVMVRKDDCSLADGDATNKKSSDMHARVSKIRDGNADCVISVHQNSYPSKEVSGPQVFYYSTSEVSKTLARNIQEEMIEKLKPKKERTEKSADDLYILKNTKCPIVICECGFLSNQEECANLQNEQYQNKIADAIVAGILKTFPESK